MKHSLLFLLCCLLGGSLSLQAQHFVEAQAEAGINHHVSHTSFMGGGAAFFDADNDGDDDLYITSGKDTDHFYLNNGDGTFSLSSAAAGFSATDDYYTCGVATGDVDNDGFRDVFVYTWRDADNNLGRNLFYRNNGDGTFTEDWPFPGDTTFAIGATFLDYDLDGWLDLYVVNYVSEANFLYDGNVIVGFDHTCWDNQFYHNNGDGTFTERSADLNLDDTGCALATAATDYNGDGDMDIYIANDFGEWIQPNKLYRNNFPTDNFTEVGAATGSDLPMYGMGIAIGDIDQDLDFDYYVTNFGRNEMIRNDGSSFANITEACGAGDQWVVEDTSLTVGWGSAFIDIDNDTDLDLYVANGYVPSPNFLPSTLFQNDKLFLNQGDLPFADVGETYGITNRWATRGMAYSDFDNDGDVDIVSVVLNVPMNETGYATLLYRNEAGNQNNWLEVKLEGVEANRDAYGSKVIVYADGKALIREVDGGSSHASHPSSRLHFGLGDAAAVDSIKVIWTGGRRTQLVYDDGINQLVNILEDTTIANVIVNTEDLAPNLENALQLAPNPTQDQVTFSWTGAELPTVERIQFYNAAGQLSLEHTTGLRGQQLSVDVSTLPKGLYYVLVRTEAGILTRKLVVQ